MSSINFCRAGAARRGKAGLDKMAYLSLYYSDGFSERPERREASTLTTEVWFARVPRRPIAVVRSGESDTGPTGAPKGARGWNGSSWWRV